MHVEQYIIKFDNIYLVGRVAIICFVLIQIFEIERNI